MYAIMLAVAVVDLSRILFPRVPSIAVVLVAVPLHPVHMNFLSPIAIVPVVILDTRI